MSKQELDQLWARKQQLDQQNQNIHHEHQQISRQFSAAQNNKNNAFNQKRKVAINSENLKNQLGGAQENCNKINAQINSEKNLVTKLSQMLAQYNEYIPIVTPTITPPIDDTHTQMLNIARDSELSGKISTLNAVASGENI